VGEAREKLDEAALALFAGVSAAPVISDGINLCKECRISPRIALELIAGVRSDLERVRVTDEAELLRYCYRVAGTVGIMMCGALDVNQREAHAFAVDLGVGMQLTNLCRDVVEDAKAGRRYLPASLVGNVEPDELIEPAGARRERLREGVAALLDLADRYYASGESGLSFLPLRARGGILVAARVYRAIGTKLRERDHAFWEGRVVVTEREKARISGRALLSVPWGPEFWRPPLAHDASLHGALRDLPGLDQSDAD
jgi:15-cis-phytoene synthase